MDDGMGIGARPKREPALTVRALKNKYEEVRDRFVLMQSKADSFGDPVLMKGDAAVFEMAHAEFTNATEHLLSRLRKDGLSAEHNETVEDSSKINEDYVSFKKRFQLNHASGLTEDPRATRSGEVDEDLLDRLRDSYDRAYDSLMNLYSRACLEIAQSRRDGNSFEIKKLKLTRNEIRNARVKLREDTTSLLDYMRTAGGCEKQVLTVGEEFSRGVNSANHVLEDLREVYNSMKSDAASVWSDTTDRGEHTGMKTLPTLCNADEGMVGRLQQMKGDTAQHCDAAAYNHNATARPSTRISSEGSLSSLASRQCSPSPTRSHATWAVPTARGELTLEMKKQKLMQRPAHPYKGDPKEFNRWFNLLQLQMEHLVLDPLEVIEIYEAHTDGEALDEVRDGALISAFDPSSAVKNIIQRLKDRFGDSVEVSFALIKEIETFPVVSGLNLERDLNKMASICSNINAMRSKSRELQYLDSPKGMEPLKAKLPLFLQRRWTRESSKFQDRNHGQYPSLANFVEFLREEAKIAKRGNYGKSDEIEGDKKKKGSSKPRAITLHSQTMKASASMGIHTRPKVAVVSACPLHNSSNHTLAACKRFETLPASEKDELVRNAALCFKCLKSQHRSRECTEVVKCNRCLSDKHLTSMHDGLWGRRRNSAAAGPALSRTISPVMNPPRLNPPSRTLPSDFTAPGASSLCVRTLLGLDPRISYGKTFLVEISHATSSKGLFGYAIVDDQSTTTFVAPKVPQFFGLRGPEIEFTLITMACNKEGKTGQIINGLSIRGITEQKTYSLPEAVESGPLPSTQHEMITRDEAMKHPNLAPYIEHFTSYIPEAEVLVLIGRDAPELMKATTYGTVLPYVHQTPLGWSVIGPTDASYHKDTFRTVRSFRTAIEFTADVFASRVDDELPAKSQDDERFLNLLDSEVRINMKGCIEMPLPFKNDTARVLPENQGAVFKRSFRTLDCLKQEPEKLRPCLEAMARSIEKGHMSQAFDRGQAGKRWYLPVFPVFNEKKGKTRLVFDASAKYHNTSINDRLLQGPDYIISLRGILTRFRIGKVAIAADIEAMFYSFFVPNHERDYFRFYWYKNNDPQNEIVEYRANVHIFGAKSSPAVAIYGLNFAVRSESESIKDFVSASFYVDDLLAATRSASEAVHKLRKTREAFHKHGIRLHKIISNDDEVLVAFPEEDKVTASIYEFHENESEMIQKTLGIGWDITNDCFKIIPSIPSKPFTRRGILAVVNAIYDPLGLVCPVVLGGRLIQREVIPRGHGDMEWDTPLCSEHLEKWSCWIHSLEDLKGLHFQRNLIINESKTADLHVFCDASEHAIAYTIYMRTKGFDNQIYVTLVRAGNRVSPNLANTIPRMELCGAVQAVVAARETIEDIMRTIEISSVTYATDSKIVLGYLRNTSKKFSRYVANRVATISRLTEVSHWKYVKTEDNPADIATRPLMAKELAKTSWLRGPDFLWKEELRWEEEEEETMELPESQPTVSTLATFAITSRSSIFASIWKNVSTWTRAIQTAQAVLRFAEKLLNKQRRSLNLLSTGTINQRAKAILIWDAQQDLREGLNRDLLECLDAFKDDFDLIRVGGRLQDSDLSYELKHPLIIPKKHTISRLLILHYHGRTNHQGRHVTLGALRTAGYYVQGASHRVKNVLSKCVICRRLRGKPSMQKMVPLPKERVIVSPPFTNVGLDVFGPFHIVIGRKTRRTSDTKKMWALIITCMNSRAVHLEVLEGLDASTFQNALRRVIAIRGPIKTIRSDRGTNFVAAANEAQEMDLEAVARTVGHTDIKWIFNPPHASHYGGVWERKIASIRRVFEAMTLVAKPTLTRDELTTLLMEAGAVVNNTPLWDISSGDDIEILTPAMLLTQKTEVDVPRLSDGNEQNVSGLHRWKRVQSLADSFWKIWRVHYLQTLQARRKWLRDIPKMSVGAVVLIKDKLVPRNHWKLGRIVGVQKGRHGSIRACEIQTKTTSGRNTILKRPIHELVVLVSEEYDA